MQVKTLCNIVQGASDNNAQEKILFNVALILLGQHCTGKNPVQFCLNTFAWNNIALVNILCNVALETTDNIAQEKILFNVALMLLRKYCTSKNLVQCCPRDSKQHCTGKNNILISLLQILVDVKNVLKIFYVWFAQLGSKYKNSFLLFLARFALLILDLSSEAATKSVLYKKLFLEMSQYNKQVAVVDY